ncbi:hypothetical protein [Micromonospora cathayae]|uniref:Restriction system protein Mrr-like N-terminal domain-containing protein n=1 Tax=Micromonospora cathayae TaxID=3028804 RepID=A0ABY7ZRJ3_9ACTN|nr:hypothetical protein [Micromonospora sp. HUAS 3]WDZ85570.1 hypothetical protein PVK37_03695 [Micromonospora sp. HUAS 3]
MAETSGNKLRKWLLLSLQDLGGKGPRAEVHQRIEVLFGEEFTPEDLLPRVGRPAKEPAWRNNVDSLYDRLKKTGVLLSTQRRGDPWELSPSGQAEAVALGRSLPHVGQRPVVNVPVGSAGEFHPKSSEPYVAQIRARTVLKSRDHESLLAVYGTLMIGKGWRAVTSVHPRDLELTLDHRVWLAEVKMVYGGDVSGAARAALGQLIEYRHFFYDPQDPPGMLGIFSEPLGDAHVGMLSSVGVACVWRSDTGWDGSRQAKAAGLIPA